jgi:hypothetical protein
MGKLKSFFKGSEADEKALEAELQREKAKAERRHRIAQLKRGIKEAKGRHGSYWQSFNGASFKEGARTFAKGAGTAVKGAAKVSGALLDSLESLDMAASPQRPKKKKLRGSNKQFGGYDLDERLGL